MNAKELYDSDQYEVSKDMYGLFQYLKILHPSDYGPDSPLGQQVRVHRRIHKYHHIDDRRYWQIESVWFDGKPVMIIREAGREGRDFRDKLITHAGLYVDMVRFLRQFEEADEPEIAPLYGEDVDRFYGMSLSEPTYPHENDIDCAILK